ncbi:MAG TPA: glycosyltransferase, partial [Desulfobacterales bacterium]|nr:glycosyltransferase [Desulfobacterales bacterium]
IGTFFVNSSVDSYPLIRIAYLIDTISCDTAGTQKQLLETIRRLDKKQFKPVLVCLWQSEWMTHNELPCSCIVLGYQGFLKWSFPGVVKRLSAIIQDKQLHIIQTFFEDSIFVGYCAKFITRLPIVLLSSRRDMGLGRGNQPWYHAIFTLALPWANRSFDGIVANSEQVRLYVAKREKTDLEKIKVIRNGVAIPQKASVCPPLFNAVAIDGIWIGLVGSLTPVKRHDLLIKAVAKIYRDDSSCNIQVCFLGEGAERKPLEELVRKLEMQNVVHFFGAVTNVSAFLYHLDIGVLCSDREGLSNAILEYMACGLPVVATSVGGNTELVDERNGICIPPDDHAALATALQRLIQNPDLRQRLGIGGLKKIQQSFSWNKTMSELENYYRKLVE